MIKETSEGRATTHLPGVMIAGGTALISGVSVFVNSYGVHAISNASVYTTAKNLVAALILAAVMLAVPGIRKTLRTLSTSQTVPNLDADESHQRSANIARLVGFAYVGVIGGGLAFALFFNGLARSSAEPSAFLHDTLVVWVAILALPLLREHLSGWNLAAIGLLIGGQVVEVGGIGHLVVGKGAVLVLAATVLWAIEIIVAKRLLASSTPGQIALVRMGIGSVVLLIYVAATGGLAALVSLGANQLGWVALTGGLLALYVGTWLVALSRARALDVTSILVASVIVTALLQALASGSLVIPKVVGLALIGAGAGAVLLGWPKRVTT
jgi:drug/metabolite transporter (DMT)-like permease